MLASTLLCMTLVIYHEARGEVEMGRIAVAAITMNRTKETEKPSTVCKVVYDSNQYSFVKHPTKIKEKEAYDKAKKIAKQYMAGFLKNPIGNRKYFNHKKLGKRYKTPYKPILIGNMLYY